MFYAGGNLFIRFIDANKQFHLTEIINKKRYKVSDTTLTYRQANALGVDHLMPDDRVNKDGWHKFSAKELIYLLIVADLKKFGIKHTQLQELWDSFFKSKSTQNNSEGYAEWKSNEADTAIGCAVTGVQIILTIDTDGKLTYYEPPFYIIYGSRNSPHITLILNDYLNKLQLKSGRKAIEVKYDSESAFFERKVTPSEDEILKIIQNEEYSAVRIKKSNDDNFTVYAEKKINTNSDITENDIVRMLKDKDFQDITVIKRDGKIVSYKVEETMKIES